MVKESSQVFNANSRSNNVKKNMLVAVFSVAIPALLVFILRKVFLDTLSLQYLGLSETFTSLLGSLTLTELGFQSAILYNLYKPIQENDTDRVNKLINILRVILNYIGFIFIVVPLLLLPFIGYILKGVEVTDSIRIYFFIIACSSAVSYFLSYPRSLIQADQKHYVIKSIDLLFQIVFVGLQIAVLLAWQSFVMFLALNIFRNICSNLLILQYCKRTYKFLHKVPFDSILFKEVWKNARNIFVGRLAGVVYASIDNLLISTFIGTVTVGMFANYATVSAMIKNACYRLFPIGAIIGNMLADNTIDAKQSEFVFRVYSIVKSIMACTILIPLLLVFNPFIALWLGNQYMFSNIIVYLFVFDMYAFFLTNPIGDFIFAKGLFEMDKKIALVGLIVNASLSVILIHFFGVVGALIGTASSQLIIWSGRCHILYKYAFTSKERLVKYVLTQTYYMLVFVILYLLIKMFASCLNLTYSNYFDLLMVVILSAFLIIAALIVSYSKLDEFNFLVAKTKTLFNGSRSHI